MSRPVLHIICQSHLDPVWLWPTRDGMAEALTTMQSATRRAHEIPEFKYTRSSAQVYRWARDTDPALFSQIRSLIDAGRWEVAGGWVEQPDCNLPSTESFIRQALYAKRFLVGEFGPRAATTIGYVPDSFGHAGGLPQVLQRTGFDTWVFMRPDPTDNPDIPLLFHWESPDGSRVLGVRIPGQYSQSYAATADDIERCLRAAAGSNFAPGFNVGAFWLGIGNHGGGPTREHLARVQQLQHDTTLPELRFSTLAEFTAAVRNDVAFAALPVVRGALGYTLRGAYSATGETKLLHRGCEQALVTAEACQVVAGQRAAASALSEAWWRLCYNQFHDILAGTCIAAAQPEIRERFGAALTTAREHTNAALATVARRVDTAAEPGLVLTAINPYPWARLALVTLDTFRDVHGRDRIMALESHDARERIPVQWLPGESNFGPWGIAWGKLAAMLPLPPCGHATFRVVTEPCSPPAQTAELSADPTNPQFGATPTTAQLARSLPSTELVPGACLQFADGSPALTEPLSLVLVRDPGGTWGHQVHEYRKVIARGAVTSAEVLAHGALIVHTRYHVAIGSSRAWLDTVQHVSTGRLEVHTRVWFNEERAILALEVPGACGRGAVWARMPGEVALRPADSREYPCHEWICCHDEQGAHALGIASDGCYSMSVQDGVTRFIIARAVPYAEHPPFTYHDTRNVTFTDAGCSERRFMIMPFNASQPPFGEIDRAAREFLNPAPALLDSAHQGTLSWRSGASDLVELTPSALTLLALKPAEEEPGFVLRVQNLSPVTIVAAVRYRDTVCRRTVAPWEIVTWHLNGADIPEIHEIAPLEPCEDRP